MSKTVTVRRGEKLPENMVGMPFAVPVNSTIIVRPGDTYPENARADSIAVEVHDDPPPQAYLIVPCERGKGTHVRDRQGKFCCCQYGNENKDHKQIPFVLTLDDLIALKRVVESVPASNLLAEERLRATIAAWSAVPQAKEAGK